MVLRFNKYLVAGCCLLMLIVIVIMLLPNVDSMFKDASRIKWLHRIMALKKDDTVNIIGSGENSMDESKIHVEDLTGMGNMFYYTREPHVTTESNTPVKFDKTYKILWYNPAHFFKIRPKSLYSNFSHCPFSNCEMTFNRDERMNCDAIIFDGRYLRKEDFSDRPLGQVWIFKAHEAPISFDDTTGGAWRKPPLVNSYNWTMLYNKFDADIHLPYGMLKKKSYPDRRNYTKIAMNKTDGVLMIASHCDTRAKRQEYVKELSKYINVKILGRCGTPWSCGENHVHDECFDLLNTTYKFYFAFENALCTQYFTEKFYENYNYDVIMVARGGNKIADHYNFPKGTYVSADDFDTAKDLGMYLKLLSESTEKYVKLLERKSMFYSLPHEEVYGNAMCNLCKRMNFQQKYHQTIPNMVEKIFRSNPCRDKSSINF